MDLATMLRSGLSATPKSIPPVFFYDAQGSRLFEEITRAPEYYLTRTERAIIETNGEAILRRANGHGPLGVVELGAGSGEKTRFLLRALVAIQGRADYVPIDVSADAILPQRARLEREIPGLRVLPVVADNAEALGGLDASAPARLFLFLGSSIGNFEPEDAVSFLRRLREAMRPADRLLLGTDLVKEASLLDAAYNDAAGVTARFNLNALARLNREQGAAFDLDAFEHRAFFDPDARRVEMHLVSRRAQRIPVPRLGLDVTLAAGESIHTENSYKYTREEVGRLADASGLALDATWTDPEAWFAVHLLRSRR